MIEFLTGPIMLCEHWYFIQMNNIICVFKGQRTKCDVCQHPAITFNKTEGGGWVDVSAYADSCKCAYVYSGTSLHAQTLSNTEIQEWPWRQLSLILIVKGTDDETDRSWAFMLVFYKSYNILYLSSKMKQPTLNCIIQGFNGPCSAALGIS